MTVISIRLKTARTAKGFSQKHLASLSGVPQSTIARIEGGDADSTKSIFKLAESLEVYPLWLAGEVGFDHEIIESDIYKNPVNNGLRLSTINSTLGRVTVRGTVQAGLWANASEWPEEDFYQIPAPNFDNYPMDKCFGLGVMGDSMDKEYKEGAFIYCIPLSYVGRKLKTGDHVIVERQHGEKYESTVKEIEFDQAGRVLLWPRSNNPDHHSPLIISDPAIANRSDHTIIRVTALVIGHFYKRPS